MLASIKLKRLPRYSQGVDLQEKCKIYSRQALATIVRIMRNPEFGPMVRLSAANAILDRGYGKPSQHVEVGVTHRLEQLTDVELREHIQQLAKDVGANVGLTMIEHEKIA